MSAILDAAAAYEGSPRSFEADLHAHLLYGYVVSTPLLFVMARPVRKDADVRFLSNIGWKFAERECDTWLVWSAGGFLAALVKLVPYPLPFVAFHRRRDLRLRIYETRRLVSLASARALAQATTAS